MLKPHRLRDPLSNRKPFDQPCMVFVNSMSDLFHEQVPDDYIFEVFDVMRRAERHTFQVLTKRPERMAALFHGSDPEPNVWLGVSIENRRFVHRADLLRETPAAVRFISAEPLLGSLIAPGCSFADGKLGWDDRYTGRDLDLDGIHWLIVGGESGPKHRPLDLQWVRDLRDACAESGTAYFLKQLGGARPGDRLEDLPEDLRIREFPRAVP